MIIPDDEMCIQQMLGIDIIPADIEREYMIRARMLHRQLAGGAIGPIAVVDLLRSLGYGPPPPSVSDEDGKIVWRRVEQGTPVSICLAGKWSQYHPEMTFQGEIGGGTVAVQWPGGRIDEYNSYEVRLADIGLPSDVDSESFKGEADRPVPDARIDLVDDEPEGYDIVSASDESPVQNEVENEAGKGDIGSDDEVPPHVPDTKINWGKVKKGVEVWLRDGDDMIEAEFQKCVSGGKANVIVAGELKPREVDRTFLTIP